VLIPDFQGNRDALINVLDANPTVLNHNVETVPRLYPSVRPEANYRQSIDLLKEAHQSRPDIPTKSGIMLGLGESTGEVVQTMQDLLEIGCRILTVGQYLQPTEHHFPVQRYIPPEEFEQWRKNAIEWGFSDVASGPFVRSSYHAKELFQAARF